MHEVAVSANRRINSSRRRANQIARRIQIHRRFKGRFRLSLSEKGGRPAARSLRHNELILRGSRRRSRSAGELELAVSDE